MDTPITKQTTNDGVDTLYNTEYRQTYHSTHGVLLEAEHIFLEGTGVKQRLAERQPTRILEVGFGTGLNFFLTACHSLITNTALHYVALEKNLLTAEVLTQLNHGEFLGDGADIRQAFLEWKETQPDSGLTKTLHWNFDDTINLELILGDATETDIPHRGYHAIYHDAFSPDVNPELWTLSFFARLYSLLNPGGNLATYSAKGAVRRALQTAGFHVQKLPGPPGKREMTVATR